MTKTNNNTKTTEEFIFYFISSVQEMKNAQKSYMQEIKSQVKKFKNNKIKIQELKHEYETTSKKHKIKSTELKNELNAYIKQFPELKQYILLSINERS